MEPVLVARDLRKAFGGITVVDGVDLTVQPGERVALLGPNGAGKTTTLLMLVGVLTSDGGTVELVGRRLPAARTQAMAQVGFAAGYLPLPDRLRVREVLRIFAALYGVQEPGRAVSAGLERFGIAHLAEQMANQLSAGQRTLVGIAKASLHRPRLLVLDEPTASLDPDVARQTRDGLERMSAEDGTSLLVTSHNMTEVERICERVVFLSAGKVVADGTPAQVAARFRQTTLEDVFLHLASQASRPPTSSGAQP